MHNKISQYIQRWPFVIGAAGVSFALAMVFSAGQSVWFDEGYSILLAKSNWHDLLALTAVDAHPPLYYALLKIWGLLFGFNEFALRALSAVMLSGAVIAIALLLRKLFSSKVALLSLPLIIMAPFLIRYGYEIRMYSTALLIAVVATYALVTAYESKKWWHWAVYAALVAIGMYTLYMTVVVWLAHVVWLFMQDMKKPRKPVLQWQWLYAFAGAVVLFLPYLTTFIYQLVHSALPGIGNEITLTRLVDIVTTLLVYTPEWQVDGWVSLLIIAGGVLTIWSGVQAYRYFTKQEKRYYWLLGLLVIVPLAFYMLTSLPPREPIFVNRYLAHIAIFMYAFLAVTLALSLVKRPKLTKQRNVPIVAYGVIAITLLLGLGTLQATGNFVFERMQLPETQQVRNSIKCSDTTTIVADDPYTYIDSAFYFNGCDLRFYSESPVEMKGGYAPLHESDKRIDSAATITTPTIVRLGWNGQQAHFVPDSRYRLVDSKVFDKQLVETYRLIEE